MARELLNFSGVPNLIHTSVLPREYRKTGGYPTADSTNHNIFINEVLGTKKLIQYYYPENTSPPYPGVLWAYTETTDQRIDKTNEVALGLFYDSNQILKKIVIKRGRNFSQTTATEDKISDETVIVIYPESGNVSGIGKYASWNVHVDPATKKLELSVYTKNKKGHTFTLSSFSKISPTQRKKLKQAGFHPKLFFAAEAMLNQHKPLELKELMYALISELASIFTMESTIRVLDQALLKNIDKPSIYLVCGITAISMLLLNNVLVASSKQLGPLSQELHAALAIKDAKYIAQALLHYLTAGLEDVGNNLKNAGEVGYMGKKINARALQLEGSSPAGFKARFAKIFSRRAS